MLSCWHVSTCKRPTFATLQSKFEHMLSAEGNVYIDFSINPEMQYYTEEPGEVEATDDLHLLPNTTFHAESCQQLNELSNTSLNTSNSNLQESTLEDTQLKGFSIINDKPYAANPLQVLDEKDIPRPHSMLLPHYDEYAEERYVDNPSTVFVANPSSIKGGNLLHVNQRRRYSDGTCGQFATCGNVNQ